MLINATWKVGFIREECPIFTNLDTMDLFYFIKFNFYVRYGQLQKMNTSESEKMKPGKKCWKADYMDDAKIIYYYLYLYQLLRRQDWVPIDYI